MDINCNALIKLVSNVFNPSLPAYGVESIKTFAAVVPWSLKVALMFPAGTKVLNLFTFLLSPDIM